MSDNRDKSGSLFPTVQDDVLKYLVFSPPSIHNPKIVSLLSQLTQETRKYAHMRSWNDRISLENDSNNYIIVRSHKISRKSSHLRSGNQTMLFQLIQYCFLKGYMLKKVVIIVNLVSWLFPLCITWMSSQWNALHTLLFCIQATQMPVIVSPGILFNSLTINVTSA